MNIDIEGHTSRAFDGALSSLHLRIMEMGVLVLQQVRDAAQAYTVWDQNAARTVLEREHAVNAYDMSVDEETLTLIARRQPVATDLRAIIAMAKIVSELERAGDEAKKIALTVLGRAGRAGERPGPATSRDARHLGKLAVDLLRLGMEAFDQLELELAEVVVKRDQDLDNEYRDGMRRLLTRAMEDVRYFNVALEAAFVLKSLERIGDHARNIARLIIAMAHQRRQPQRQL